MVLQIISCCIAAIALIFTALAFKRSSNKDLANFSKERAELSVDVRYIRQSIDEFKVEFRALQNDVSALHERITIVEQSAKSAHKRLDDIKKEH